MATLSKGAANVAMGAASGALRVTKQRLNSVDLLRGIVMVIMALDHIRDYLTNVPFPPEDIVHTNGMLFFTRWITHFCAPTFFFLAGTGAYLWAAKGRTPAEVSSFLLKRGLWLVVLEWTVIGIGWTFLPYFGFFFGGVIICLGVSMIVLSGLVRLPFKWIAAFGVASIFLHNLLDPIKSQSFGRLHWVWQLLHQPGFIPIAGRVQYFALYVLIPWTGVMAAGYAFGAVMKKPEEERRRLLWMIGGGATALFILLRLTNVYGNPAQAMIPWAAGPFHMQATLEKTVIAFFNVTKYPPSLQFLCMTLGPGILALAWFDRFTFTSMMGRVAEKLVVFGRVPLFFYILHIYACHIFGILAGLATGQPVKWMVFGGFMMNPAPPGWGHDLPFVWASWALICFGLYFPCKWFAGVKQRRTEWWLRYL